jgi:hypothetical protein
MTIVLPPKRIPGNHRSSPLPGRKYPITSQRNTICQVMLYWWSRSINFALCVKCSDLYDYLVGPYEGVSKNHLGRTIRQCTTYDPRLLKKLNGYPVSAYAWRDQRDLQYGCEWMLGTWLSEFLQTQGDQFPTNTQELEEELDIMAACSLQEIEELYIIPLQSAKLKQTLLPMKKTDRSITPLKI